MKIDYKNAEIINAPDTLTGIAMEHEIISHRLSDSPENWRMESQELHHRGGRFYDLIIMTGDSEKKTFCFDITPFFGVN